MQEAESKSPAAGYVAGSRDRGGWAAGATARAALCLLGLLWVSRSRAHCRGCPTLPLRGHPQTHSPLLPSLCPTTLGSKQCMTPSELQGREGLCHQTVEGLLWGVTVVVGRGMLLVPGIAGCGSRSTV